MDVSFVTACSLLTEAIDTKSPTDKGSGRDPYVGITAVRIRAVSFSKVQAHWGPLRGEFM